ncbi:hypothetical protein BDN67DRAFT_990751 [Paxillus ammoniavirescens]|nr:hypothetical protein BDN67DRAFT_990751 [Paxillus ammoniavirescens]
MGHYGNGTCLEDIAWIAGISEGSVEPFTEWCFKAIESLHDAFVCMPMAEEKEFEKVWMDNRGWVMYDGTIVVLYTKPGLNGDAYFTQKFNYGLNLQIGNLPSNLWIVDYAHGLTGSAHDASAFEQTAAVRHTDWFFQGDEFAWVNSAYPHCAACCWITIAVILHNLVIDIDGVAMGTQFTGLHTQNEEKGD